VLALGVCVWVGEARADSASNEIAVENTASSLDLAALSGGGLSLTNVEATGTQTGGVNDNTIDNSGGSYMHNGGNISANANSGGITINMLNSGNNVLMQNITQINVYNNTGGSP
jgi:hypothetical protein